MKVALSLVLVSLIAACSEQIVVAESSRGNRALTVAEARCAEDPAFVARTASVGDLTDANGNGVLCERNEGTPEMPRLVAYDDLTGED